MARRHSLKHVIGLAIALILAWMVFFGAGYFGAVWTHYFADEPPQQQTPGEVSVKVIGPQHGYIGLMCEPGHKCPTEPARPQKPNE